MKNLPSALLKSIALYREGRHWDAHEALEDAWRDERDLVRRRFYHGIIQLAAACHHMDRDNMHGLKTLLRKAHEKLSACPSPYLGVDVDELCEQMDACRRFAEAVECGEARTFDRKLKPRINLPQ